MLNRIKLLLLSYRLSSINLIETMSSPIFGLLFCIINAFLILNENSAFQIILFEFTTILLFAIIHSFLQTYKTISSTIRHKAIRSIQKLFKEKHGSKVGFSD